MSTQDLGAGDGAPKTPMLLLGRAEKAKRKNVKKKNELFPGLDKETVVRWYEIAHLGRLIEARADLYSWAKGWSYHAPFAGHDGIRWPWGRHSDLVKTSWHPPHLLTALSAGMTPYEIVLNGLSKDDDVAVAGGTCLIATPSQRSNSKCLIMHWESYLACGGRGAGARFLRW